MQLQNYIKNNNHIIIFRPYFDRNSGFNSVIQIKLLVCLVPKYADAKRPGGGSMRRGGVKNRRNLADDFYGWPLRSPIMNIRAELSV